MALLLSKKPLGKKIVTVFAFICKQRLEYGYGSGSIFICQVNIVLMDTYELKDIDVGFDFPHTIQVCEMIMSSVFRRTHFRFYSLFPTHYITKCTKYTLSGWHFFGIVKRSIEVLPLFFVDKNHIKAQNNELCLCYCCKYCVSLYIV